MGVSLECWACVWVYSRGKEVFEGPGCLGREGLPLRLVDVLVWELEVAVE